MNYIKRKTNVRQHSRQTKNQVVNVVHHERNLKGKKVVGTIPLKDLNYKQSKKVFPSLRAYGDIDRDGVVNKRDCKPFDVKRQDDYEEERQMEIRREQEELAREAAREADEAEARERQRQADEDISNILAREKQRERSIW